MRQGIPQNTFSRNMYGKFSDWTHNRFLTDSMQSDGNSVCGDVVSQDQKCKKWIFWNLYYGDFELKD